MSCYFVAQININDKAEYQRYLDGFDAVFDRYAGEVIMVEENPVVLEGKWPYSRIVMIRFPNKAEARRWYDSDAYQALVRHRWNAANADIILAEGRE